MGGQRDFCQVCTIKRNSSPNSGLLLASGQFSQGSPSVGSTEGLLTSLCYLAGIVPLMVVYPSSQYSGWGGGEE